MSDLLFRDMVKDDFEQCARLYISVFNDPPWRGHWTIETACEMLLDMVLTPAFWGAVCVEEGQVLGCILGYIEIWHNGPRYFLKGMFISSGRQGERIGSQLDDYAKERLLSMGVKNIYLFTARDSEAERFYRFNGYIPGEGMILMHHSLDDD